MSEFGFDDMYDDYGHNAYPGDDLGDDEHLCDYDPLGIGAFDDMYDDPYYDMLYDDIPPEEQGPELFQPAKVGDARYSRVRSLYNYLLSDRRACRRRNDGPSSGIAFIKRQHRRAARRVGKLFLREHLNPGYQKQEKKDVNARRRPRW